VSAVSIYQIAKSKHQITNKSQITIISDRNRPKQENSAVLFLRGIELSCLLEEGSGIALKQSPKQIKSGLEFCILVIEICLRFGIWNL
jgi:hypothetical protein